MSFGQREVSYDVAQRVFFDSRERDVSLYPSANHFVITFPRPIKNVREIILSQASIPNIGDHKWVSLNIRTTGTMDIIQGNSFNQLPIGSFGVVDLTSGAVVTNFYDTPNHTNRIIFRQPVLLIDMDLSLYCYNGYNAYPKLYELPNETFPPELDPNSNWHGLFTLVIEQ